MEFKLARLSDTFKKQENPACAACGYEAEWLWAMSTARVAEDKDGGTKTVIEAMSVLFCERDLRDAFLDAYNFSVLVPDALD